MSVRHENARSAAVRTAAWIGFGLSCACAVPAGAGAGFINHTAKQRIEGFSHEVLLESADSAILAVGQVESVDVNGRAIVVLGQRFVAASASDLSALKVGAYVAAAGEWKDGHLALRDLRVSAENYVSGSSHVLLRGIITSVDSLRGQLRVGHTLVDYTPSLANGLQHSPTVGSVLETYGIQPASNGTLVADSVAWEEPQAAAMKRGISGGDLNGISGGDRMMKRGISGGDIRGISGGDYLMKRGISGGDYLE